MSDARVFGEDDRLELIEGEILTMAPTGPWHENAVDILHRTSHKQLIELGLHSASRLQRTRCS
jgi:Uma2 family endonuclease